MNALIPFIVMAPALVHAAGPGNDREPARTRVSDTDLLDKVQRETF